MVCYICRFVHKSVEARVAEQRGFSQTTLVKMFYGQHIYINRTANLPQIQRMKDGA